MATGRFAPSPTGDLHLGNLRTALLAWLFARSAGSDFLLRMEDLDQVQASVAHERSQRRDLAAIGLDLDGRVVRQSERFDRYEAAIAMLTEAGLTYSCYCTRREIREAAAAPHGDLADGTYPGTCRRLSVRERSGLEADGRPPALRLIAEIGEVTVSDELLGPVRAVVDDVVLRRNDGVPAYNLAVVVDDAAQGVEQVIRGDDLASSAPRQRHLATLLGLPPVRYAHVPLVLGPDGHRLAKRDGPVTLADQAALGVGPDAVRALLAATIGFDPHEAAAEPVELADRFDPARLPRQPWIPPALPSARSARRGGQLVPNQPSGGHGRVAVVVAAHGSRAEAANQAHRDVVDALADALSADLFDATADGAVTPAFLELAEPDIPDAINAAAATDVGRVLVVPYFLHPGRHLSNDLPAIVDAATARHPGIEIRLLGSFGAEPGVLDILAAQVTSAIAT